MKHPTRRAIAMGLAASPFLDVARAAEPTAAAAGPTPTRRFGPPGPELRPAGPDRFDICGSRPLSAAEMTAAMSAPGQSAFRRVRV